MRKCDDIKEIDKKNECKFKIIEEEIISIKKRDYPIEDFANAVKDYAEPKFNALGVRMGNVETAMVNMDTKLTNMDTKLTNMDTKLTNMDTKLTNMETRITRNEETIVKGIEDLKKGQVKIAKEPAESLYK